MDQVIANSLQKCSHMLLEKKSLFLMLPDWDSSGIVRIAVYPQRHSLMP